MSEQQDNIYVSIIVPCYKVERYLPKCLASLVGQTLQNIEIICINDGSPDGCLDIMREWERMYPSKIVVIDKANEGVWRGRWDGIRAARGEYIGFVDSDDYVEPDFAELLYYAAKEADADLVVGGFSRVDLDTSKILSREFCEERPSFTFQDDPGRMVELNGAPWNKLFRASILKRLRDLNSPPPVLDDLAFHLIAYPKMDKSVVFVPKSLINYMVRAGSIINSITMDQVDAVYAAMSEVKARYVEERCSTQMIEALDAVAFLHLGVSFNYRLASSSDCDLTQAIDACTAFLNKEFPTWKRSPYICGSYARTHGPAYKRLHTAWRFYRLGLFKAFLRTYDWVLNTLQIDIKW